MQDHDTPPGSLAADGMKQGFGVLNVFVDKVDELTTPLDSTLYHDTVQRAAVIRR